MYRELKEIYNYFEDEESRFVFQQRLLYSLTGDWKHIIDLVLYYRDGKMPSILDIIAEPEKFRDREIILFGAGSWGWKVSDILHKLGVEYFGYCDNNCQRVGNTIWGKKVISVEELLTKHKEAWVLIATELYEQEIVDQLRKEGFAEERILRMTLCEHMEYMDNEIMTVKPNEIFVDAGCYDGRTSFDFIKWAGRQNVSKIYAFEPDAGNYNKCMKNMGNIGDTEIEMINAGLWSKNTILHFDEKHHAGSKFDSDGSASVSAVSLDAAVKGADVSFIKMDIEGAELEALRGAVNTIQSCRPRMAICVYHRPEDIIEIPKMIKELVPEYQLRLRHYMPNELDTVLYAVC